MEIPNHLNSGFTSDPHSQHIDAILILWVCLMCEPASHARLPCGSGLTQSSVRNGFEAHVFGFRTDFTLKLEYYWGYCLFVFVLLSIRSVEGHGAFIKVFHFNLEESKGHFILGWATKNSSKLARLATKRWS